MPFKWKEKHMVDGYFIGSVNFFGHAHGIGLVQHNNLGQNKIYIGEFKLNMKNGLGITINYQTKKYSISKYNFGKVIVEDATSAGINLPEIICQIDEETGVEAQRTEQESIISHLEKLGLTTTNLKSREEYFEVPGETLPLNLEHVVVECDEISREIPIIQNEINKLRELTSSSNKIYIA